MELDKELWGTAIPDVKIDTEDDSIATLFDESLPMPEEDSIRLGMISIISAGMLFSLPRPVIDAIHVNIVSFGNTLIWPLVLYAFKKGYKKAIEDKGKK